MEIDAKIKRDALKTLHKVQIAVARNMDAARADKDFVAFGFLERILKQASNLGFLIQYGEDK